MVDGTRLKSHKLRRADRANGPLRHRIHTHFGSVARCRTCGGFARPCEFAVRCSDYEEAVPEAQLSGTLFEIRLAARSL